MTNNKDMELQKYVDEWVERNGLQGAPRLPALLELAALVRKLCQVRVFVPYVDGDLRRDLLQRVYEDVDGGLFDLDDEYFWEEGTHDLRYDIPEWVDVSPETLQEI